MVTGLRWALHPENAEDVKIYPKTKHTTDVLDRAAKNKSTIRVTGTWKQTVDCHYVEISRVTIVKRLWSPRYFSVALRVTNSMTDMRLRPREAGAVARETQTESLQQLSSAVRTLLLHSF